MAFAAALPTNALGGFVYGSLQRFVNVRGSVARIPGRSSALADRGVMDEPRRRRLPLRHKSRSTSGSQTAPVEPATTSARWLDVLKHKPLPTRGVTTAVWNPHQAGPLRPACCSWKGAVGQPATAFPANRRNRSWAPVLRRRKHLCRRSVKKIAGRETRDASWTVPKLHLQFC